MDIESAHTGFSAMGSQSRLEVLQSLVRAGPTGLSVGEVQERTGIPASTLAHHLKALVQAGLVSQHKAGRTIFNKAEFEHLENLAQYILSECCADEEK